MIILVLSFLMNLLISGRAMHYMIMMIRSLQMILHLPMLQVIFPGNISMMFTIMVPIVMFDIFNADFEAI